MIEKSFTAKKRKQLKEYKSQIKFKSGFCPKYPQNS